LSNLEELSCDICNKQSIKLNAEQSELLLEQLPEWSVSMFNDLTKPVRDLSSIAQIEKLHCKFKANSYPQAVHFTNQIAHLAEEANHHPEIILEYGAVTVSWWTHTINGLHKNDFIMAAKTSKLYKELSEYTN
jgi:4a-hydroxytetrahydrobiopterin dehydratase